MKGVVFTEFLSFATAEHGEDFVDDLIDASGVSNGGAYTAVGTYDFKDMQALIVAFSKTTAEAVPNVLHRFGSYLCDRFMERYPEFFKAETCLFDFLGRVDNHIHVEVTKLYPDAELPKFSIHSRDERRLELDYASCRALESLAEGMIQAAALYYRRPVSLSKQRHPRGDDHFVRFSIEYAGA